MFLCVQTSRISIQTDHYNQLLLNFSFSEESTRICHNSFYWLEQCLLPGNMSLLNTLHQKVIGSAQALLNIALLLLGNTNSNFGIERFSTLVCVCVGSFIFVRVFKKYTMGDISQVNDALIRSDLQL